MKKQEQRTEELTKFASALGLQFNDITWLDTALTHPSFANEKSYIKHNQRLEFLGDAVLDVVVSDFLFHNEELDEGKLTKIRSNFVDEKSLAQYAQKLHLGDVLLLGNGAEKDRDRVRPAVLADTFEAVIGAIYKDRGLMAVKDFVLRQMQADLDQASTQKIVNENYKTMLQEHIQSVAPATIEYKVVDRTGPAHNPLFTVVVSVNGKEEGRGQGHSRRVADQEAAKMAYDKRLKNVRH